MRVFKASYLKAFFRKWRKVSMEVITCATYGYGQWTLLNCTQEEVTIPKDVPKGCMAVYVGEEHKRYVIRVALLEHPTFRALLDEASEVYEYCSASKLCIPCNESIFLGILNCLDAQQDGRSWLCF